MSESFVTTNTAAMHPHRAYFLEPVPVSAYVGSSKNLKDLMSRTCECLYRGYPPLDSLCIKSRIADSHERQHGFPVCMHTEQSACSWGSRSVLSELSSGE